MFVDLAVYAVLIFGFPFGVLVGYLWRARISRARRARYLAERNRAAGEARQLQVGRGRTVTSPGEIVGQQEDLSPAFIGPSEPIGQTGSDLPNQITDSGSLDVRANHEKERLPD
jgi:hypothetical protein